MTFAVNQEIELAMTDTPTQDQNTDQQNDQGVRIPVTPKFSEVAPEAASLIREYEERYGNIRDEESSEIRKSYSGSSTSSKQKVRPSSVAMPRTVATVENERLWAMLAHASVLITLFFGLPTAGLSTLLTLFVPLMIYFYYRERSEFVAYHAMQAFALQIFGTIGWVVALVAGMLAGSLIILVLAITIVGLLVVPFVALAMILFAVASFGMPIAMVVFGLISAWEAYQGKWYRIPYLGQWLERQMRGGFLSKI